MIEFATGMKLLRSAPGSYRTEDGRYAIVQTEWTGPRGGKRYVWEIGDREVRTQRVEITVGAYPPAETLRESIVYLRRILGENV